MAQRTEPRKIVWAVDAFDDPNRLKSQVPAALNALAKTGPIQVLPVYVLSPGQINLSVEFSGPWIHQYRPAAERALQQILRGIKIPGLGKAEVIAENFSSTSQAAKTLSTHAFALGADLILVTSHGRKGVSRLFLGSFAESLLYQSRVPVMILGPKTHVPSSLKTLLVPTQFGPRSKGVFKRVVASAREMGMRIILFHAIPHPIEPILQSGAYLMGGSWVPVQSYFSEETDRQMRRAELWARWARHQGVDVEVVVDTQGGSVGDSIVYLADSRGADLIAMESRTGPVASTLIGSVTRYVIHHTDRPVWVLRSLTPAEEQKRARAARYRRAA